MVGNGSAGGKSETGNRHPYRNAGLIPIGMEIAWEKWKASKEDNVHNCLINNNLLFWTKNRFFSSEEPPVRKEAMLSGFCEKNILTFAMPRQWAEWQARGSVRAIVRIAQRFLLLIYRTNPVTGSEAPMSEAMNMRNFLIYACSDSVNGIISSYTSEERLRVNRQSTRYSSSL